MEREKMLHIAKPILFNTDMVKAILENRKSETRRLVKFISGRNPNWTGYVKDGLMLYNGTNEPCIKKSPYKVGDYLYVRETWCHYDKDHIVNGAKYAYRANTTVESERIRKEYGYKWNPSIYMPKEAARIFLQVTDVRVERLQDIDGQEAYNEGANAEVPPILEGLKFPADFENWKEDKKNDWFESTGRHIYMAKLELANRLITGFQKIWDSTVPEKDLDKYGWNANPWAWVIQFKRVEV